MQEDLRENRKKTISRENRARESKMSMKRAGPWLPPYLWTDWKHNSAVTRWGIGRQSVGRGAAPAPGQQQRKTITWEPKDKRGVKEGLLSSSFNSIQTFSSHSFLGPPLGDGMHKVDKENILLTLWWLITCTEHYDLNSSRLGEQKLLFWETAADPSRAAGPGPVDKSIA